MKVLIKHKGYVKGRKEANGVIKMIQSSVIINKKLHQYYGV